MKYLIGFVLLCWSFLGAEAPQNGYKLMPPDRWGSQSLGGPVRYPHLAALARISGDVITLVVINQNGKVDQFKHVSGAPQLRPTVEFLIQSIVFKVSVEDGEGPWLFFVTSRFDLQSNKVYCYATPKEAIPHDLLKKQDNPLPAT